MPMGRPVTSGIKGRKRTTVYLTRAMAEDVMSAQVRVEQGLNRHVDRTLFMDALLKAGLRHPEDIKDSLGIGARRGTR